MLLKQCAQQATVLLYDDYAVGHLKNQNYNKMNQYHQPLYVQVPHFALPEKHFKIMVIAKTKLQPQTNNCIWDKYTFLVQCTIGTLIYQHVIIILDIIFGLFTNNINNNFSSL